MSLKSSSFPSLSFSLHLSTCSNCNFHFRILPSFCSFDHRSPQNMPVLSTSSSAPESHAFFSEIDPKFSQTDTIPKMDSYFDCPTAFSTACNSPQPLHQETLRKRRRVSRVPVRGPESADDSRFQGITFSFATADASSEYLHVIHSVQSMRPTECRVPSPTLTLRSVSPDVDIVESESEVDLQDIDESLDLSGLDDIKGKALATPRPFSGTNVRKTKQCACCGCTSTPLWRDMGKNQPLCNACGIRWKKYGVVCDSCQYVPCKQERESKSCKRCLAPLPPAPKRIRAPSPPAVPKKPAGIVFPL